MANAPQPNARHLMLSRFRKGKQSVPGTYMSAAGIQSELSPNCLHKIAVHEAVYRKHVNLYRQDLQQKVDVLKKNQNVLKKSVKYYRNKKRENRKKRYHAHSSSDHDLPTEENQRPHKQLLIIVDEHGKISKPMRVKRKEPKPMSDGSFRAPSLISDSCIALEFEGEDNKETTSTESSQQDDFQLPDIPLTESFTEDFPKDFVVRQSASDLVKPVQNDSDDLDIVINKKQTKSKLRRKGTIQPPNQIVDDTENEKEQIQEESKSQDKHKVKITSQSLDQLPSSRSLGTKPKEHKKQRESKSATDQTTKATESTLPSTENPGTSNQEIVDNWLKTTTSKTTPRKANSQTSAFMQLVRMKQTHSMSKHMNMIDKLISGSKNKRLVYLRRISEVSDSQLGTLEHSGKSVQTRETAKVNTSDQVDSSEHSSSTKHVKLPPIEPEPETDNPVEERYKKVMRRMSVAALQPPEMITNEIKEENPIRETDSPKIKPKQRGERLLPSAQVPPRDVDKFLKNERDVNSSYGRNVTWQESLAKLRDVHYVFPSKIVEDKGFIL